MNLGIVAAVFALIFVAELPDKTAVASFLLAAKYRPGYVFAGAAAAFGVHACLAVVAGSLLTMLPHRPLEAIVGVIFLAGAAILLRSRSKEAAPVEMPGDASAASFWRIAGGCFVVILVAEFGDLTQVLTASLAARYHNPVSVLAGSVLALWVVAALAITGSRGLLRLVPVELITRLAALVMTALGVVSLVTAATG